MECLLGLWLSAIIFFINGGCLLIEVFFIFAAAWLGKSIWEGEGGGEDEQWAKMGISARVASNSNEIKWYIKI